MRSKGDRCGQVGGPFMQDDYRARKYFWFSPLRASHFLLPGQEKVTKEKATPTFGHGYAVVRSLHRRSRGTQRRAFHGPSLLSRHPCRSTPSTTIPLTLLKGTWRCQMVCLGRAETGTELIRTRSRTPVRRPSGGVAQGDEPHGCGERLKGPWMALVSRPPERHRNEGSLAIGQTRMPGALSLWLLSLCARKEKVTRPGGRNQTFNGARY